MLVYSAFTGILLFSMLCVIIAIYDPCNGRSVRDSLCELYEDGMVSGRLCYSLCKERVPVLSNCLKQQPNLKVC
uniref:FAM69 N-terminal domain-containing protein n=2 Tax=Octopus bimaculoides TaxID=37653 RepID=A0A0L8I591_OCTBM